MHLKTFLLVALVMVLAMGMGCGAGSSPTTSGGDGSGATLVGTWTRVDSNATFPQQIVFNSDGTGTYLFPTFKTSITWTASGGVITISTGSAQPATINLTSTSVNTFILNSLGTSDTYNRG
ncbi:MAG: hypothetical protein WA974_15590 [Thermodesulfobacteriota bacterium]|jgi:hypothetical protein